MGRSNYNPPSIKTPDKASFCIGSIPRVQIMGKGRIKIMTLSRMFGMPAPRKKAFKLIHLAPGVKSQRACIGTQLASTEISTEMNQAVTRPPVIHSAIWK